MSLEIKYLGKLGNNLFQYCVSRIYAENHNLYIETYTPRKAYFIQFSEFIPPNILTKLVKYRQIRIRDMHFNNKTCSFPYHGVRRYKFRGYFQNSAFINKYSDRIMGFFEPYISKKNIKKNIKDILLLIRIGID